jgi:hypothetical protein
VYATPGHLQDSENYRTWKSARRHSTQARPEARPYPVPPKQPTPTSVGYLASIMEVGSPSPSVPRPGSRCQSSSVTKGMSGCSRRRPISRLTYRHACATQRGPGASDRNTGCARGVTKTRVSCRHPGTPGDTVQHTENTMALCRTGDRGVDTTDTATNLKPPPQDSDQTQVRHPTLQPTLISSR